MARKYNTQHPDRGRSHYPDRLSARGLSHSPQMPKLEDLRHKQTSAYWLERNPTIAANLRAYAGSK